MIIGEPSRFAIESGITNAYHDPGLRALGFFSIRVGGRRYGVHSRDATMLACSFDEVARRLAYRGRHAAPFAAEANAGEVADAILSAVYADEQQVSYLGESQAEFVDLIYSNHLIWAPDGDEAFDDSSFVLQFDLLDRVRLIAFTSREDFRHEPTSLKDLWLTAEEFYHILQRWHDSFVAEWTSLPKTKSGDDRGRDNAVS